MTRLSELKRNADKYVWTMVHHSWGLGKLINLPRGVIRTQSNGIWLESPGQHRGSWLQWDKATSYKIEDIGDEIHLTVKLNEEDTFETPFLETMKYILRKA